MSEIASDWSLSALLLFGGVFTTLTVGAAIFLAESWFQKMRQRESISRFGKTGGSKSGKRSNANPFSGSIGPAKKAQSKVTKVSDDNNEGYRQKIGQKEVAASG